MNIVELTCKKCNGIMEVKEDEEKIVCPFCGTTNWIVDNDEIRRDKAKYNYLKEKAKAHAESTYKRDIALYKFLKFKYLLIAAGIVAAIVLLIVLVNSSYDPNRVTAPASSSNLIGKQYTDVENMFIDAGYVNVETKAVADLQNGFLYDAKNDDGKVTSVSIGGQDKFVVNEGFLFKRTDYFDKNDQVRIVYRTIPEPTRSPEDIAADSSVNADWTEKPIIQTAYEIGKDQFKVKWEGKAPAYVVRVDGAEKTVVDKKEATFKLENGLHSVQIVPINRETRRDDIPDISGPITIKTNPSFNLGLYNMQKEHLVAGVFSDEIRFNYAAEKIYDSAPGNMKAAVDLQGAVHVSFTDPIGADAYIVSYKTDNQEYAVSYDCSDETSAKWIAKNGGNILIILDTEYLQSMNKPAIQPDKDYSFSVVLQKNPVDYVTKDKLTDTTLKSRGANVNLKTTPVWKEAPVITFGEQTADGEITLRWDHPAVDLGCSYSVSLRNKAVFITTGESELTKINGAEAVIRNLQNGSYTLVVTPENEGIKGNSSAEFTVVVNNNWSQAPEVALTQIDSRTAKVEITHIFGIDAYQIKVSCGNTANILSFVNLDYSLYGEYTVDAVSPVTEYTFIYEKEAKETDEIKVKFDIYGIHNSEDGTAHNSATKTVQITLKPQN